jgi:hypothetical protein
LIKNASISVVGSIDFFGTFAILGVSNTINGGTFLNRSSIIAALVVILTLKVEILKLNNEIVNIDQLLAALAIKLD